MTQKNNIREGMFKGAVRDFAETSSHYIILGFGVITALGWRDLVESSLTRIMPQSVVARRFIFAAVLTVILIILTMILPMKKRKLHLEKEREIQRLELRVRELEGRQERPPLAVRA